MQGDWAYVDGEGMSFVPDRKITYDAPTYVYRPMRGYGHVVAVIDVHDNIIGWMPIEVLGFETVREWMSATGRSHRSSLEGSGKDAAFIDAVDRWAASVADDGDVELAWAVRGFADQLVGESEDLRGNLYARQYRQGQRAAELLLSQLE